MDKGKVTDLIALIVIVALGLGTAYVTFGILQSQASTEVRQYSLGGAIAGALVAMSMFFSAYLQFRRSSGEMEKLTARVHELQQKVLRGAPCPRGFEIEVDERQRIVLAKPGKWEPRGGTIFDFELPKDKLRKDDIFPARLQVGYGPFTSDSGAPDTYYEKTIKLFETPLVGSCSTEFINVGGEPDPIKSLKVIAQLFAKITITANALTGKDEITTDLLSLDDFKAASAPAPTAQAPLTATAAPDQSPQTTVPLPTTSTAPPAVPTSERVRYLKIWQMQVVCVHQDLQKVFILNFYDDEHDFTQSSAMFNNVVDSVRFL